MGDTVKVGQVWRDNDKRMAGRHLKVVSIDGDKAICQQVIVHGATGSILPMPWGRETRIALRRFRPTASGYVLVKEA